MSYHHGEPVPPEIPKHERGAFAALRSYRRKKGEMLTVEEFANRRKWGFRGTGGKRNKNAPQTADGVREILRAKGLAP